MLSLGLAKVGLKDSLSGALGLHFFVFRVFGLAVQGFRGSCVRGSAKFGG